MSTMIVTGASTGVGKAIVERFAGEEWTVCAVARSEDKLKALEDAYPGKAEAYPADVSDRASVEKCFDKILSDHEAVDVLVNNAGIVRCGNFWEQDMDLIDRIIDTNLKGTIYCTHKVLQGMIERKSGHIINVASVGGIKTGPNGTLYHASKYGQVGFGHSLAQALLPHGILLVTLCPGTINTPLWDDYGSSCAKEMDFTKKMQPEEIADLVAIVLSQPKHIFYKDLVFFPRDEWH